MARGYSILDGGMPRKPVFVGGLLRLEEKRLEVVRKAASSWLMGASPQPR